MVEQEMQQNPILEEVAPIENQTETHEAGEEESPTEFNDPADPPAEVAFDPATEKNGSDPVDDFQAEFDRLVQMDQDWKEHFSQTNIPLRQKEGRRGKTPVHARFLDSRHLFAGKPVTASANVRITGYPQANC